MFNETFIYKILRYLLEASIIYLLLRYFPYNNITSDQAFLGTLIVIIIFMVLEIFISRYLISNNNKLLEKFEHVDASKPNCPSCKIKTQDFTPDTAKVCKLVCNDGKEHFNEHLTPTQIHKTAKPIATAPTAPAAMPASSTPASAPAAAPPAVPQTTQNMQVDSSGTTTNVQVKPDQFVKPVSSSQPPNYQTLDEIDYNTYGLSPYNTNQANTGSTNFNGMFYDSTYPYNNNALVNPYDKNRQANEIARIDAAQKAVEDQAFSTSAYPSAYQTPGAKSETYRTTDNSRTITGTLDDELPYGDYNQLPMAAGYKSHDYEYGYNFIPPEKWYPQPVRPPICVTNFRSPVYPSLASGTPTDVKEFYNANRITQPDRLNTAYVTDKLNSGR